MSIVASVTPDPSMTDDGVEAAKAALRAEAHRRRAGMHLATRAEAAKAATEHFFSGVTLALLMDAGQPVCLPVVKGETQPLDMRLWREGDPLYPSGFGTMAPEVTAPSVVPDLILIPLLGFDSRGTRLGYGGGYYDRTLAASSTRPRLIGFAFAVQQLDLIPHGPHDVPLDAVITEQGITQFPRAESA